MPQLDLLVLNAQLQLPLFLFLSYLFFLFVVAQSMLLLLKFYNLLCLQYVYVVDLFFLHFYILSICDLELNDDLLFFSNAELLYFVKEI